MRSDGAYVRPDLVIDKALMDAAPALTATDRLMARRAILHALAEAGWTFRHMEPHETPRGSTDPGLEQL